VPPPGVVGAGQLIPAVPREAVRHWTGTLARTLSTGGWRCPSIDADHNVTVPNTVNVTRSDSTSVITIDRPHVRNAVDRATAQALYDAFVAFEDDPELTVAVLTGSGGTFCAGADLQAIATGEPNQVTVPGAETIIGTPAPMGPTRLELTKPVIAAIEGHAVAGGLELAVWADLRVAAEDAVLGVFCRRWGVPLIDGGTIRLPRLIGEGRAADLSLTGRAVGAEEALRIGLVDRVAESGEALPAALRLAAEIAVHPQECLRADRRSARANWGRPMAQALADEVAGSVAILAGGLAASGAKAFGERSR
jgi:enoyl-CoA hydratase